MSPTLPKAPRPINEDSRLHDLHRLEILDSEPEENFDRITRVAADYFDVPIALVSLVDENRQWFKSRHGLDVSETSRDVSFCAHTILKQEPMVIPDALQDSRFAESPLVTKEPSIRFYAGAPLISRYGHLLGTLCLIDTQPRELDAASLRVLTDIAAIVTNLMELRLSERKLNRQLMTSRQQNELLKESELRLQTIFDSVLDSILILNVDGMVHTHNDAAEELFGYASADLLGIHARDLMPDYFDREAEEYFRNFKTYGQRQIFLGADRGLEGLRNNGERFPLELTLSSMQIDGQFFYSVIIRDISKQKAAEIALLAAKKEAEALSQAKSDFLARASHELRTPLNSIIGFSDILLQDLAGAIPDKPLKYLQLIHNGGRHLASLINEIIEISRIESGKQTFSVESVDVDQLIDECWNLMQPQATSLNLKFGHKSRSTGTRHVNADQQRLKQVLLNLLSNAIKYNRPEGSINTSVETNDDGKTTIRITDTGKGIPADKTESIFNVFERLAEDEYTVEGSGIGLALSRSLITAMGGEIGVESTRHHGSTFWIRLQTACPSSFSDTDSGGTDIPSKSAPALTDRYCKLLYIEDNPANLTLIEALFSKYANIELLSANCAAMAYVMAIQHQPDLILLDVHLPDEDGFTVLQKIQSMPKTADIPMLVVTADATAAQRQRFLAAGAEAYITKPIDQQMLIEEVSRLLADTWQPSG